MCVMHHRRMKTPIAWLNLSGYEISFRIINLISYVVLYCIVLGEHMHH